MPRAQTNGIEIHWESMGEGIPLVLVMGIAAQLVHWPEGFCRLLADPLRQPRHRQVHLAGASRSTRL